MTITATNKELLSNCGIKLKKECKTFAVIQLNNNVYDTRISRKLYDKLIYAASTKENNEVSLCDIVFGVELEFVGSNDPKELSRFNYEMTKLFKEKYVYTGTYTHNDGTSWILGKDSSIKTNQSTLSSPFGFELSSPKYSLCNKDDLSTVNIVLDLIKTLLHGEVNNSCGTHIHIGFEFKYITKQHLQNLLRLYSELESKVFDTIVPKHRRRNRYCKPTSINTGAKFQKLSARYCKADVFTNNCSKIHLELRQLEGTLDYNTIINWVTLQSTIIYDILSTIVNISINTYHKELLSGYADSLRDKNIFDLLFSYKFSNELVSFFIDRVIKFKSRTI